MLRLAAPLAMAELGWMAMGFVDTVMAGRLGAAAIGAGSLGGMLFFPIVDLRHRHAGRHGYVVAQAFGASDDAACRRTLVQGIWIALGRRAGGRAAAGADDSPAARDRHQPARDGVARPLRPRAALGRAARCCSTRVFRRYLQAMDIVRPITFAVVSANLLNFAGNWLLMYGNWGAPRLGLEGSGYSTSISRALYRAGAADRGALPRAPSG